MNAHIDQIKKEYENNPDLIIKEIKINKLHTLYVIFLETLCSQNRINDYILKRITTSSFLGNIESEIPGGIVKKLNTADECEYYLASGYTLIIDKEKIYAVETKADITRSVSTNERETSIRGPKDAFVENYQTNIGLIKRRIKNSHLKTKNVNLGRLSNNTVGILYIDNIAKEEHVNEIYNKLKDIDIDIILDTENLMKFVSQKSLFPTVITTERPDRCAEALSEGKIVIVCDNSPNALIVPAFLIDFINPFADKYTINTNINFTKIIRLLCFFLSALVPALYIAIINYNQEAIPTSLIINFAIQRNGVPFPGVIECIIMLIICEILRESDLRFPSKYGSAISILGALVLGEAAVNAGLVSPIMIIISAFTYISTLIFTEIEIGNALRNYRFFMLALSALLGIYGLLIGFITFIINLCNTKSLGIPYTFPASPYDRSYFKEFFIKQKNYNRSKSLSDNLTKEKKQ